MVARAFCTCDTAKFKLQSEDALTPGFLPSGRLAPPQRDASTVEYALLVALVALIAIPSVKMLGTGVFNSFEAAKEEVAGARTFPAPCQFGIPNYPGCL